MKKLIKRLFGIDKLEAEKQALSRKRLGPGAGAKISDIGK